MAGPAWRFLQPSNDCLVTLPDVLAAGAMCQLATGSARDIPLLAGESAAAGLAGLSLMCKDGARRKVAHLDAHSRVLLIHTEGAMSPAVYQQRVGETAGPVLQRQPPIARQAPGADRQGFL
ncbi:MULTISPECIES: hypothetical protein [Pseudomonas]|uniref:hypothetical protein n=1 Tax=Pseudomonas TaxID=286 RepID=UPI000B353BD9|nr:MULTISPECIES: hypothetical protein [Pseudomonas]PMY65479.1 hypothetical protein C1Y31_15070 [Pseudomonas sp. FW305-25]PMY72595.1 hypothetical protein C1Y32_09210 [Pseudomonas sp. FW126-L8]PNA70920.1 hypothetical protein C1Y33_29805 [Pseudomonas sp. FW305-76]